MSLGMTKAQERFDFFNFITGVQELSELLDTGKDEEFLSLMRRLTGLLSAVKVEEANHPFASKYERARGALMEVIRPLH